MNNQHKTPVGMHPSEANTTDAMTNPVFLDKCFPSLTLIGGMIAVLMLLFILSGWKVVKIEQEQRLLAVERSSLAKDRDQLDYDLKTYKEILGQLPELQRQRQDIL